jgi:hypothetical protein
MGFGDEDDVNMDRACGGVVTETGVDMFLYSGDVSK